MDEVKPKIRYNKTLLNHIINRDSITLIGEYDILTCQSDIKFICLCSKEAQKKLKSMYEIGSKCKECTNKSKGEKITYKLQKSKDDQTTRNNELIIQDGGKLEIAADHILMVSHRQQKPPGPGHGRSYKLFEEEFAVVCSHIEELLDGGKSLINEG